MKHFWVCENGHINEACSIEDCRECNACGRTLRTSPETDVLCGRILELESRLAAGQEHLDMRIRECMILLADKKRLIDGLLIEISERNKRIEELESEAT